MLNNGKSPPESEIMNNIFQIDAGRCDYIAHYIALYYGLYYVVALTFAGVPKYNF